MPRLVVPVVSLALLCGLTLRGQQIVPGIPTPSKAGQPAADTIATSATETIVFIRHGEKPADDKGQLTCQGLNRALALPKVLFAKFGRPDFIFAPLTAPTDWHGRFYCYIRPLMTIEPTAIMAGLPVDTRFPAPDIGGLQKELTASPYRSALVFVAWEHRLLVACVRHLLEGLGDAADKVPDWPAGDYDSIYIVKIRTSPAARTAAFTEDREMLDGLSDVCPTVTVPAGDAR
jgi:hypothetical protein